MTEQQNARNPRTWSIFSLLLVFGLGAWFVTIVTVLIPFWLSVNEISGISRRIVTIAEMERQNRQAMCLEYSAVKDVTKETIETIERLCAK